MSHKNKCKNGRVPKSHPKSEPKSHNKQDVTDSKSQTSDIDMTDIPMSNDKFKHFVNQLQIAFDHLPLWIVVHLAIDPFFKKKDHVNKSHNSDQCFKHTQSKLLTASNKNKNNKSKSANKNKLALPPALINKKMSKTTLRRYCKTIIFQMTFGRYVTMLIDKNEAVTTPIFKNMFKSKIHTVLTVFEFLDYLNVKDKDNSRFKTKVNKEWNCPNLNKFHLEHVRKIEKARENVANFPNSTIDINFYQTYKGPTFVPFICTKDIFYEHSNQKLKNKMKNKNNTKHIKNDESSLNRNTRDLDDNQNTDSKSSMERKPLSTENKNTNYHMKNDNLVNDNKNTNHKQSDSVSNKIENKEIDHTKNESIQNKTNLHNVSVTYEEKNNDSESSNTDSDLLEPTRSDYLTKLLPPFDVTDISTCKKEEIINYIQNILVVVYIEITQHTKDNTSKQLLLDYQRDQEKVKESAITALYALIRSSHSEHQEQQFIQFAKYIFIQLDISPHNANYLINIYFKNDPSRSREITFPFNEKLNHTDGITPSTIDNVLVEYDENTNHTTVSVTTQPISNKVEIPPMFDNKQPSNKKTNLENKPTTDKSSVFYLPHSMKDKTDSVQAPSTFQMTENVNSHDPSNSDHSEGNKPTKRDLLSPNKLKFGKNKNINNKRPNTDHISPMNVNLTNKKKQRTPPQSGSTSSARKSPRQRASQRINAQQERIRQLEQQLSIQNNQIEQLKYKNVQSSAHFNSENIGIAPPMRDSTNENNNNYEYDVDLAQSPRETHNLIDEQLNEQEKQSQFVEIDNSHVHSHNRHTQTTMPNQHSTQYNENNLLTSTDIANHNSPSYNSDEYDQYNENNNNYENDNYYDDIYNNDYNQFDDAKQSSSNNNNDNNTNNSTNHRDDRQNNRRNDDQQPYSHDDDHTQHDNHRNNNNNNNNYSHQRETIEDYAEKERVKALIQAQMRETTKNKFANIRAQFSTVFYGDSATPSANTNVHNDAIVFVVKILIWHVMYVRPKKNVYTEDMAIDHITLYLKGSAQSEFTIYNSKHQEQITTINQFVMYILKKYIKHEHLPELRTVILSEMPPDASLRKGIASAFEQNKLTAGIHNQIIQLARTEQYITDNEQYNDLVITREDMFWHIYSFLDSKGYISKIEYQLNCEPKAIKQPTNMTDLDTALELFEKKQNERAAMKARTKAKKISHTQRMSTVQDPTATMAGKNVTSVNAQANYSQKPFTRGRGRGKFRGRGRGKSRGKPHFANQFTYDKSKYYKPYKYEKPYYNPHRGKQPYSYRGRPYNPRYNKHSYNKNRATRGRGRGRGRGYRGKGKRGRGNSNYRGNKPYYYDKFKPHGRGRGRGKYKNYATQEHDGSVKPPIKPTAPTGEQTYSAVAERAAYTTVNQANLPPSRRHKYQNHKTNYDHKHYSNGNNKRPYVMNCNINNSDFEIESDSDSSVPSYTYNSPQPKQYVHMIVLPHKQN